MRRREFIRTAGTAGLAVLGPPLTPRRRARLPDAHVEVLLNEPIGTIAPEIYGHFTEHLGGVIYDGVWVGEGSKVPNVAGVRRALAEALRVIKPSV